MRIFAFVPGEQKMQIFAGSAKEHANIRTKAIALEADLGFTGKDCPQGRGKVVFNAFYAPW